MFMKSSLIATIALGLAASLSACGGSDPKSDPTPSTSASTSPSPTSSPDAGGPPADWESKFTPTELTAAHDAMDTWEQFSPLLDEIYRQGKLTPGAKATLQKYDFNWQRDIVDLGETYDKGGLRLVEGVKPLWSYVKSVRISADGTGWVVIDQCTDYRPLRYTRNGSPQKINKPKHLITQLKVTMTKPDNEHGWMHEKSVLKDKTSCSAE
jgi:hypothetical protein